MLWLNWSWVGVAVATLVAGFIGGCVHEKREFDAYKEKVAWEAAAQERITQQTIDKQKQVAKEVASDYQSRIDAIRKSYGRVYNNGAGLMPTCAQATCGSNAGPSYAILAESCAETTQQLVSLQDFIKETQ